MVTKNPQADKEDIATRPDPRTGSHWLGEDLGPDLILADIRHSQMDASRVYCRDRVRHSLPSFHVRRLRRHVRSIDRLFAARLPGCSRL